MPRTSDIRPKVGTVTEDKYDALSLCHRKTWVSKFRETDAAIIVTYTTTRFYKKGTGSHDFYKDGEQPDGTRTCHYCKCSDHKPGKNHFDRPVSVRRDWNEKCPVEQLHRHTSTQTLQKFLVVGGKLSGKRLAEVEAGDNYAAFNRNSRWGKSDAVPKVILVPLALLKGKK